MKTHFNNMFCLLITLVFITSCSSKKTEITEDAPVVTTVSYPEQKYTAPTPEAEYTPVSEPSSEQGNTDLDGKFAYKVDRSGISSLNEATPKAVFLAQVAKDQQRQLGTIPNNKIRLIVRDNNDERGRTDSVYELDIDDSFTLKAKGAFAFHKYSKQNIYLLDVTGSVITYLLCEPPIESEYPTPPPVNQPIVVAQPVQTTQPTTPANGDAAAVAGGITLGAIIACILCCL